jgi:hypothetical protein
VSRLVEGWVKFLAQAGAERLRWQGQDKPLARLESCGTGLAGWGRSWSSTNELTRSPNPIELA